jgi:hypothetical protein
LALTNFQTISLLFTAFNLILLSLQDGLSSSNPEVVITPATPATNDASLPSIFKTPSKAQIQSQMLFTRQGVNFGAETDQSATFSTNFNPFSPVRAPTQELKVKGLFFRYFSCPQTKQFSAFMLSFQIRQLFLDS